MGLGHGLENSTDVSMLANNVLLGGGFRVRECIRKQGEDQRQY